MKNTLLFLFLLFASLNMAAQNEFITKWLVPDYQEVIIPTKPGLIYNYTVDWGDGVIESGITGTKRHKYIFGSSTPRVFTVKISGVFPAFYNNGNYNDKLISIEQWGNIQWKTMESAFYRCENLVVNTFDNPNLSQVTNMSKMFFQVDSFSGNLNGWDVSNVTNMKEMFFQAGFNEYIGDWNVGNVKNMVGMLEKTPFNQDISNWNVSNVTDMSRLFSENVVFNQDLGRWNINNVTNFHNMFNANDSALSTANYDALLTGWSTLTLPNAITFNQPNLKYCTAGAARTVMQNKGWTFYDGGQNCNVNCGSITTWNGTSWSNAAPNPNKKAVFAANYNTTLGSINACSIQINPGVTVTVSPGTTIKMVRDLAINGNLIFLSTATGNGELAQLGAKAAITGKATVQRYTSSKRAYRMLSPAVSTTNSIMANWQEGVHNTPTSGNLNPNPGFGTHITGSTTGANGFDATGTGNPSMFTVNVASQQFQAIANTDANKLRAGEAYLMMVRGDRSINLGNNSSFGQTTLRATGKLTWGKKHLKFVAPTSGAFVMFGNPYQSAVNIKTVFATSTNVNTNHYYIYDPTLGANGAYVTVGLSSSVNVPASSSANKYLQPGQGAQLASMTAGGITLDFLESDKAPGQFTSTNATGNTTLEDEMLMGQLFTLENFTNNGPVHDGFGLIFADSHSNAITPEDAVKPMNFYENLGIDNNGTYLSLEKRALPVAGENLPLYINGYGQSDYVLQLELNGLEDVAIYLDDNFNATSTLLEQGSIGYAFSVDASNPASKASDRFAIRVDERLSVNNNDLLSAITLYPNPMMSQFTVGNPNNVQLENAAIYDITGRLIQTVELKGATSEVTLDVSNLASATYMVVINSENGQMSKLMVKE